MRTLSLLLVSMLALAASPAQDGLTVSVAPFEKDGRWVVVEYDAKGKGVGDEVYDEKGNAKPGQRTSKGLAWLVAFIPAGQQARFTIKPARPGRPAPGTDWTEAPPGVFALKAGDREITRYHVGADAEKYKKPFFYPLITHGVNLLRGSPMDPHDGEPNHQP